jgi:hypothetical protein
MINRRILPLLAAVVLLAACGEETRNGQLTLSGSQPVRVIDQGGAAVDFVSGPLKVTFGAESRSKFTVELEQSGRKAKFSGKIPGGTQDWNVTIKGGDIGQPVDLSSARSVAYYGPVWTSWGMGDPCGMNGRWETEQQWQKGREDWKVSFADAGTGKSLGAFSSVKDQDYLISSRNTWCRERPMPEPRGPRWDRVAQRLGGMQLDSVNFDSR